MICRMYPSFPASYNFSKGENKDFWLLSIKAVEGKLPASTITTSLNTFPLNPSLNTFFSAQLPRSQHSGTDSFLFSKREQKLLWEKRGEKKPQPLKVQSTNDCVSSVALWTMPCAEAVDSQRKEHLEFNLGPAPNSQQSLEEMLPLDQGWLFTTSAALNKGEFLPARTIQ